MRLRFHGFRGPASLFWCSQQDYFPSSFFQFITGKKMLFHQQLKEKIVTKENALKQVTELRAAHKKIVFTNGCFDIVHPGHVDYLCQARDLGDFLVLGLNTDYSVKRLNKAPDRPVNNEHARAAVLAGLA